MIDPIFLIFLLPYVFFVIAFWAWRLSSKIENTHFRRAVKISIIFLVFPLGYTGHVLLLQCWMIIVWAAWEFNYTLLLQFVAIWAILVAISQIGITKSNISKK